MSLFIKWHDPKARANLLSYGIGLIAWLAILSCQEVA